MAMTHDYMDYLNEKVGICPAGSQEELQAADTIADLMRQHDVEPSIEEFDAKSFGGTVTALLYALMFVGIVLGGIGVSVLTVIGLVLADGPAALFILKYLGHDFISPLGPTTRSQNVVAFHKACGPNVIKGNRPIVIVAHYDSPHENVLRTSPVAPYIPLIWRVSKYCVLVVGVCMLFQPLAFLPEVFRRLMWVIGILAALPLAVLGVAGVLAIRGAKEILVMFFCYCAVESTAGLWASSYMVMHSGIDKITAASWASLFYVGITVGRALSGFLTMRFKDPVMIRLGQVLVFAGILTMFVPLPHHLGVVVGLVVIGFGCAPIYPCVIHSTPAYFGEDKSQAIVGVQMACAYVGSLLMPPLFGIIAQYATISLYPWYLLVLLVLMVAMHERLRKLRG